jgi:hypothetical protein
MRCPVCRAENDEGPQCRRCRADLALLFTLEQQRRQVLDAAYRNLVAGDMRRARALSEGARALHDDGEARRISAVCALLCGDFAAAWRAYLAAVD